MVARKCGNRDARVRDMLGFCHLESGAFERRAKGSCAAAVGANAVGRF